VVLTDIREFLSKVSNRCPAIKFAVRRTHNVIGRIRFLIISIITIKDTKAVGVPCGTRCVNMWFVFLVQPNIRIVAHIANDMGSVIVMWDVKEKMFGNKAIKFIIRIVVNMTIIIVSVLFSVFFIVNFTSFFIVARMVLFRIKVGFLVFHILIVVRIVKIRIVSQDRDIIVELGSKIENRFVIILVVFFLGLFFYFLLLH